MAALRLMRRRFASGARLLLGTCCLGSAAVTSASSTSASATSPRVALPEVSLVGAPVARSAPLGARARADRYLDQPIELSIGETSLSMSMRDLGASVDVDALEALLEDSRDPEGRMHALREELDLDGPIALRLPVRLRPEPAMARILDAKRSVDHAARDARFDLEARRIVPEEVGQILDVYATLDRIEDALRSNASRVEAVIHRAEPRRSAADLADLSVDAVVAAFETRYSLTDEAADRTHNLHVAAERIDGMVLLPGESFDFNEVVGPRTQANGFRNATVIAGGELAEDIGGGACQISGTLHAAALFAGLAILERQPHSRPSSYIKLGLDAMVNYPTVNFRFENDLPFPVLLHVTVSGGTVRAEVLGAEKSRLVTFVRRVDGFAPFVEDVRDDPALPLGVRVLDQRGVAGFRVTRFRVVRDPGANQAFRTRSRDVYPPTTQIWRVGTGEPAPEDYVPPTGDTHPEYRADEYITMTQGPELDGTIERRRAGTTGTVGWTAAAGMPQAEAVAEEL